MYEKQFVETRWLCCCGWGNDLNGEALSSTEARWVYSSWLTKGWCRVGRKAVATSGSLLQNLADVAAHLLREAFDYVCGRLPGERHKNVI